MCIFPVVKFSCFQKVAVCRYGLTFGNGNPTVVVSPKDVGKI